MFWIGIAEAIFLFSLLVLYFRSHITRRIFTRTDTIISHPQQQPNMMARGGRRGIPFNRFENMPNRQGRSPDRKIIHEPTPKDCIKVKNIIAKASNFPPEVVDIVMDFAEYWACSVASIDYTVTASRCHTIHGGRSNENQLLVSPLLIILLVLRTNSIS